mgnify:CR=1 FL=1
MEQGRMLLPFLNPRLFGHSGFAAACSGGKEIVAVTSPGLAKYVRLTIAIPSEVNGDRRA